HPTKRRRPGGVVRPPRRPRAPGVTMPVRTSRFDALDAAKNWPANGVGQTLTAGATAARPFDIEKIFGENTFGFAEMRDRLPKPVFAALLDTIENGSELDPTVADAVAIAMKEWAREKGATHYTHWFQPLTGLTAEK